MILLKCTGLLMGIRALTGAENTMIRTLLLACCLLCPFIAGAQDFTTIYLVRHAEKVDSSRTSGLTEVGTARAKAFSTMLRDSNLTHVFSTPFVRTKSTAAPTAEFHSLDIEEYDPDAAREFAEKLKNLTGSALVVGHSNTIPNLVNLLTGERFDDLDERVYDKIYIVRLVNGDYSALEIIHSQPRTPLP